jgi:hypothetical protein
MPLSHRIDTTVLSGVAKGQKKSRQLTTFQVDLQYPEPAHSSISKAAATASPKTVGSGGSCPPSPLLLPQSPDKCPSPMPTHLDPGAAVTPLSLAGTSTGCADLFFEPVLVQDFTVDI